MIHKGLAVLLMSATAGASGPATGSYWTAGTYAVAPHTVGAYKQYAVNSPSSSRRERVPGDKPGKGVTNSSSGSIGVGEMPGIALKGSGAFIEEMLLGAALYLQATQSPLDHEIQAIVSRNFESYWD